MTTISNRIEHCKQLLTAIGPTDALGGLDHAAELREQVDLVIAQLVDVARSHDESWTKIGQAIGTTKQAAFQRYGPKKTAAAVDVEQLTIETAIEPPRTWPASTSTPLVRGECPTCRKTYQLTAAGAFPKHQANGETCAGSRTPASAPALSDAAGPPEHDASAL